MWILFECPLQPGRPSEVTYGLTLGGKAIEMRLERNEWVWLFLYFFLRLSLAIQSLQDLSSVPKFEKAQPKHSMLLSERSFRAQNWAELHLAGNLYIIIAYPMRLTRTIFAYRKWKKKEKQVYDALLATFKKKKFRFPMWNKLLWKCFMFMTQWWLLLFLWLFLLLWLLSPFDLSWVLQWLPNKRLHRNILRRWRNARDNQTPWAGRWTPELFDFTSYLSLIQDNPILGSWWFPANGRIHFCHFQDLCYYQGKIVNESNSLVSVSTCDGLRYVSFTETKEQLVMDLCD